MPTLQSLRTHAIAHSLFAPTTLRSAINKLGFVQADPIRSPARAQDLILRHRVKNYRAGDLEMRYASLDIEEDVLYAYGFMQREIWRLLHPRKSRSMTRFEKEVLETVRHLGVIHPRDLDAHHGSERVTNDWGGYSKATTRALEALHHRGLLRIARRENGIRIYETAPSSTDLIDPELRLRELLLRIVNLFAPTPEKSLHARSALCQHWKSPSSARQTPAQRRSGTTDNPGCRFHLANAQKTSPGDSQPSAIPRAF